MNTLYKQQCRSFLRVAIVSIVAAGALFVLMGLLSLGRGEPALAQGSATTITQTLTSDFGACSYVYTNTVVSSAEGGEIRLAAWLEDYFDDPGIDDTKWITVVENDGYPDPPWQIASSGFFTTHNGGIRSVITVPVAGRVVDIRARLQQPGGQTGYPDIGFGRQNAPGGPDPVGANRLFIADDANQLSANARDDTVPATNTLISGIDLTQFHLYRIEWGPDQTLYSIDGVQYPTATVESTWVFTPYVWLFSQAYGNPIDVDWVRVSYYPTTTGQYESCPVDTGQDSSWTTLSWTADLPAGTAAAFQTRSSVDGSTWSAWQPVSGSGGAIPSPTGRYLQYRITLSTSDVNASPQVESVVIGYEANEAPTADAGGPYVAYEGVELILDGSGSSDPNGDPLTYEWDLDYDGSFDVDATGATTAITFPDGPDTRTVALRVSDPTPLTDVQSTTVTINNVAPTADAGANQTVPEGGPVNLSGTGTDVASDTLSYAWDFDYDGASFDADSLDRETSTSYPDGPETYTVALRVSDEDGGETIDTLLVTVTNVAPTADIGSDRTVQEGSDVSFVATITDPGSTDTFIYLWAFGDGTTSTSASPGHAYADNGVYTATLTVYDDDGGGPAQDQAVITVTNVAPTVDIGADRTVQEGSAVPFSAAITDPGSADTFSYLWTFGDGATSTAAAPSHAYADNGVYTATVTISDDDGGGPAQDQAVITVTNVAPAVDIGADRTVLEGIAVPFAATIIDPGSADTFSYLWAFGDGVTSTVASPSHVYEVSGVYTATVSVYDDDGGLGQDQAIIAVTAVMLTVDIGADRTVQEGSSVPFSATIIPGSKGPFTYLWTFGDGATSTVASPSHVYADNGVYTVTLTAYGSGGSVGQDQATITVTNVAPVIDAGGIYSATVGKVITFTVAITDVPADSHVIAWDLDDNGTYETSGQSVTRTYASAGTYQVRVRVTDDDGGAATDVAQVVISGYTVYLPAIAYNASDTPGRLPPD